MPISQKMVAQLVARLPAVVAGRKYEDDPHSFRSLRKSNTIAAREPELPGDAAQNPLLVYMYEALALEQKQLLLAPEEGAGTDGDFAGPRGGGKWFDGSSPVGRGETTRGW
jgi:hypothetical protein